MKLGNLVMSRNVQRGLTVSILGSLLACSAGAPGSEPTAPGASPSPPATNPTTLSVQGALHGADGSPVDGATVCLRADAMTAGEGPCTTSDSTGSWPIATVPANSLVAITFEKASFVPTLRAIATETTDVTLPAAESELATDTEFAARIGAAQDASTGSVAFLTALPGSQAVAATASLRPLNGPDVAGPRYDGEPAGAAAGTSGVFTGLADGFYVLTLGDASAPCASAGGLYGYPITLYAPASEARIMVPVVAGFVTTPVAAACTTAPTP
jgi:hypothetical protein